MKKILIWFLLFSSSIALSMDINGQLKKAQLESLSSSPTGSTGRVYYDTTLNVPQVYNGSAWAGLGGAGGGEKNYISSGTSTQTGWAFGSGLVTNVTTTSAAELPEATVGTGIKFAAGSAADYGAFCWTMDKSDFNKKMKVQFSQLAIATGTAYVAGDFAVEIHSHGGALCTSTDTKLALSTDVSGVSSLPNLTGVYRTTFDSGGSALPSYDIRIVRKASTSAIVLSSVVVGPGVVTQGAAVTDWTSYTPTLGTGVRGTNTEIALWRRVGTAMQITYTYVQTAAGTAGSGAYSWSLPSGYTIDSSKVSDTFTNLGNGYAYNGTTEYTAYVYPSGSTALKLDVFTSISATAAAGSGNISYGNTVQRVFFNATVPIAEWAGSGTVNVVQNDLSYYYSTGNTWGTTNASATTSQGNGGVLGGTTTPTGTSFTYAFTPSTPVMAGAKPVLEVSSDQLHWTPTGGFTGSQLVENLRYDGTNYVGGSASLNSSGNIVVTFGKYASGTATAWTGTWYWRVTVGLPGQAIGFSNVTQTGAGLVQSAGQLLGTNTNDSANAGNVGEYVSNVRSSASPSETVANTANFFSIDSGNSTYNDGAETGITLTAGDWDLQGHAACTGASAANVNEMITAIGTAKGNDSTGTALATNENRFDTTGCASCITSQDTPLYRVNISATTTYYLKERVTFTVGASTVSCVGSIRARRVR